jgi:hypothetical protein
MNRRLMTSGVLGVGLLLLSQAMVACGADRPADEKAEVGSLSLPLATHGPSGQKYRLRDATFEIRNPYSYGSAGEGGASSQQITVSSEDDPTADTINVSLEEGYYIITLQPGWQLRKVGNGGGGTDVEATLLSGESQWVYISPHSTSWAEFQFGLGDRELWLNGDLNIEIQVHEDPDDYYGGYGGFGGTDNVGGAGG